MSAANECYKLEWMQRATAVTLPSALTDLITSAATLQPVLNAVVKVEVDFTPTLVVEGSVGSSRCRECTVKILTRNKQSDSRD
jgi:hypothetical protein